MLINRKKYQAWIKPVCSLKGMLDFSLKNCLLRPDSLSSLLERYMRNYSGSYLKKIMTQDSKSKHKTFPKHIYHYTKMAKRKMNRIMNHNFFKILCWKHFFFFFFFFFFFLGFNKSPAYQVTHLEFKKFKSICEKSDSYFSLKYILSYGGKYI